MKIILFEISAKIFIKVIFKILKNHRKEDFNKLFNFLFALSLTVGVMFWAMYLDNPNSVLQAGEYIPLPLNLFIHGGTFVLFLTEQLLIYPRKTNDRCSILVYATFIVCYIILLESTLYLTGYAVYPFVKEAKPLEKTLTYLQAFLMVLIGHALYYFLSRVQKEESLVRNEQKTESAVSVEVHVKK